MFSFLAAAPSTFALAAPPAPSLPYSVAPSMVRWARSVAPPDLPPEGRLERLLAAMLDPAQLGLRENHLETATAAEVFASRRANCAGLAYLFVGLARSLGLPAYFVDVTDVYTARRRGDLQLAEGHLAAAFGTAPHAWVYDFAGVSAAWRHRLRRLDDRTAVAIYYSNRGAEMLLAERLTAAVVHLRAALRHAPELVPAWVNLGVAERRRGDLARAEDAYRRALALEPRNLSAARNLAALSAFVTQR